MKISEEMAVRLHRMMWSDMQKELGNNPDEANRLMFKKQWIEKNFPDQDFLHTCFLCEYAQQMYSEEDFGICHNCPIEWPGGFCNGVIKSYATMPISELLALPTRHADPDVLWNYEQEALDKANRYLKFREEKLSNYSGLPASSAIVDHVKKIQEKAVEEYFEERPGAKLASMNVDEAFKQYAKEQMEPLKQMNDRLTKRHIEFKNSLALESGLDRDRPVIDHIKKIRDDAFSDGEDAERERIMNRIGELLNHDLD